MGVFREMLSALGAEEIAVGRVQYTVIDGKGGYFRFVRRITEFSPSRIVLAGKKGKVCVEGRELSLGKCEGGDVAVLGAIERVEREE